MRPDIKLNYILTTPTGFDPAKESLPMIVFLHGAGERGNNIDSVKAHGVPKHFSADPDYRGLRVITLSPQCPDNVVWTCLPLEVMSLVKEKAAELNADPARISLTGLSMGGFGTWELGSLYPDFFCALGPVCGSGSPLNAHKLVKLPIWAFHGDLDDCVPCWRSSEMVNAVNKLGGNAQLTICEGVWHNSWENAYDKDDLIPWLAAQSR
ncbi:MAG: dienelactone hydrolase family protein [Firmicutes bacterium]|nr:dienelactone hydrolase family protein [Bacillota bacterium]